MVHIIDGPVPLSLMPFLCAKGAGNMSPEEVEDGHWWAVERDLRTGEDKLVMVRVETYKGFRSVTSMGLYQRTPWTLEHFAECCRSIERVPEPKW